MECSVPGMALPPCPPPPCGAPGGDRVPRAAPAQQGPSGWPVDATGDPEPSPPPRVCATLLIQSSATQMSQSDTVPVPQSSATHGSCLVPSQDSSPTSPVHPIPVPPMCLGLVLPQCPCSVSPHCHPQHRLGAHRDRGLARELPVLEEQRLRHPFLRHDLREPRVGEGTPLWGPLAGVPRLTCPTVHSMPPRKSSSCVPTPAWPWLSYTSNRSFCTSSK